MLNKPSVKSIFIVYGKPMKVLQLEERSFNDPSFRQNWKLVRVFVWSENDLHGPAKLSSNPVPQRTLISTIGKNLCQSRKFVFHLLDNLRCTLVIMKDYLVDRNSQRKDKRVNYNMFLTTFDLCIPINTFAGKVRMMRCLCAPKINDPHARTLLVSNEFPNESVQSVHDILKQSLKFPLAEIIVICLLGAKSNGSMLHWQLVLLT